LFPKDSSLAAPVISAGTYLKRCYAERFVFSTITAKSKTVFLLLCGFGR